METGGPEALGRPGAGDPSVQFYPPFLCNFTPPLTLEPDQT